MKEQIVKAVYFSPTKTTQKVVCSIAGQLAQRTAGKLEEINITRPQNRLAPLVFDKADLVVFGLPVYAGRVPNVLLKYLNTIVGNDACAIAVVLYGNRNYDDALIELRDILTTCGCRVAGAGAFVGEHAFSRILAANRPDAKDLKQAQKLADEVYKKWQKGIISAKLSLPGNSPSPGYFQPRDRQGNAIDIRKVKPIVDETCDNCGICAQLCPMGSISPADIRQYTGICIKCGACIKGCPKGARDYQDPGYLYHKTELEEEFKKRRESEIWI